jgi:uncharacterized coiled-coil DUF342 family protein
LFGKSPLILAEKKRSETMKKILILTCIIALVLPLALTGCKNGAKQKAELERLRAELQNLKAALQKTETERDELKDKIDTVAQARDQLQKQVNDLTNTRDQLKEQFSIVADSREQLNKQLSEVAGSRDQLRKRISELIISSGQLQSQIDELTKSRNAIAVEARQARERIDELASQLAAEMKKVSQLQDQITGKNKDEESEKTRTVEVIRYPTIHSFDTSRSQIKEGQSSTLTWWVSDADEVRIEPGIGTVSSLGSKTVAPSTTTTYTIIATNKAGESRETRRIEVN